MEPVRREFRVSYRYDECDSIYLSQKFVRLRKKLSSDKTEVVLLSTSPMAIKETSYSSLLGYKIVRLWVIKKEKHILYTFPEGTEPTAEELERIISEEAGRR